MKGIREEYPKGSGRWRIRFSWRGKRYDIYTIEIKGKWFPLSEETARYLHEHLSRVSDEPGFDMANFLRKKDRPFAFTAACELWLEDSDCSPDYLKWRRWAAERWLKPYFLGFDIRDIRSIHIIEYKKHLRDHGLSEKTVYNHLGELKAMLNFHRDSLHRFPTFPRVTFQEPTVDWLTSEQQDMIFEHIREHDRPIFTFMRWTGCRPNEAAGLLRENVHRDKGYVVLATVIGQTGEIRPNTKTRISKPLPITPEIEWTLIPRKTANIQRLVFLTITGKPYRTRRLEDLWDEAVEKALEAHPDKLRRVSLYPGLKHSFGGQRINAGYDLNIIAQIMGHTDSRTTQKYAKLKTETLAKVMRGDKWVQSG